MSLSLFPFLFDIKQGYSYSPTDAADIQQPLHGMPLRMANYVDTKKAVSAGFVCTRAEHNQFQEYFYNTINGGANEFVCTIDIDGEVKYKKARFVPNSITSSGGGPLFTISCSLIVQPQDLTFQEMLVAFGVFDGWDLVSSPSSMMQSFVTDFDIASSQALTVVEGSTYSVDFANGVLASTFSGTYDESYGFSGDCCIGMFYRSEQAGIGSSTEFTSQSSDLTRASKWGIQPYKQGSELSVFSDDLYLPTDFSFGKLPILGDTDEHFVVFNRTVDAGVSSSVDMYVDNVYQGTVNSTGTGTEKAANGIYMIINAISQVATPFIFDRTLSTDEIDILYNVALK